MKIPSVDTNPVIHLHPASASGPRRPYLGLIFSPDRGIFNKIRGNCRSSETPLAGRAPGRSLRTGRFPGNIVDQ
jgi:hypothetical protein